MEMVAASSMETETVVASSCRGLSRLSIVVNTVWSAARVGVWLRTAIDIGVIRCAMYLKVGCDEAGD